MKIILTFLIIVTLLAACVSTDKATRDRVKYNRKHHAADSVGR